MTVQELTVPVDALVAAEDALASLQEIGEAIVRLDAEREELRRERNRRVWELRVAGVPRPAIAAALGINNHSVVTHMVTAAQEELKCPA